MQSETASMKIRSYFSHSVEQAIQDARQELGGEAILITSRRSAPHDRHLGAYEVVFGSTGTVPEATTAAPAPNPDLNRELAELRDQMESIKRALAVGAAIPGAGAPPEYARVHQQMSAAGLDAVLAQQIVEEASKATRDLPPGQRSAGPQIEALAAQSIRSKLQFAPEFLSGDQDSKRCVVFIGPPGAGKTTTLAKIAIRECLGRRLSTRIISVDPHRVGSHEKLRSLAKIMGLGFTAVNSIREFLEAVDEFRSKDMLLIDTPGFSAGEFDSARDLAGCLSQLNPKQIHLVLPAWMSQTALQRYIRLYSEFQPDYLLFTNLDETGSQAACLGAAIETGKPLSFFTNGQSIPEDIQPASSEPLLANLFGQRAAAISAA
jgi:flagellar biosynthesis protein FlhF